MQRSIFPVHDGSVGPFPRRRRRKLKSEGRSVLDVPCWHLPMIALHARHSDIAMNGHVFSQEEERFFQMRPRHQGKSPLGVRDDGYRAH
jgi:hypothetical protein